MKKGLGEIIIELSTMTEKATFDKQLKKAEKAT
jgi:hypothetical protein